jgi:hypothetical protein
MTRYALAVLFLAACAMDCGSLGQAEQRQFPLSISENGRFLVDSSGAPFLYNADTAWFVMDRLSVGQYRDYLDDRAAKKFNVIQVMAPWNHDVNNYYGEPPFLKHADLSTPNEKWWDRLDSFADMAAERGMAVNITALWLGYRGQEWFEVLTQNDLRKCRQFGRFLGKRYRNRRNVIFTIGGDHDPQDRYPLLNQIALGIKDVIPKRLLTAHAWEDKLASDVYGSASWLDLNSVYTYFPRWNANHHVYALCLEAFNRMPSKPFILIESGYEKGSIPGVVRVELSDIRREVYWSILCGSTGFAYGNSDIWPFRPNWAQAMNDPGASQVRRAYELLSGYAWHTLVPDQDHSLLIDGYGKFNAGKTVGGDDYAMAACAADGTFAMVYVPNTGAGTRTMRMDTKKLSVDPVRATWFNPVDGARRPAGVFPRAGGPWELTTPGENGGNANDWVLVMQK